MRILFVSDEFPWPADTGYRIRVANAFEALAAQASVDLFVASDPREPEDRFVPEGVQVARVAAVNRPVLRRTWSSLLRWLVSGQPRAVAWRRWASVLPDFTAFAQGQCYDAAWYSHSEVFLAVGINALAGTPAIVDIDNLESFKAQQRFATGAVGDVAEMLAERLDMARWRLFEARAVAEAAVAVVCSDMDRCRLSHDRLAHDKVIVVPNGYDRVDGTSDARPPRPLTDGPPTATFVGLLHYPPNADAARRLAREVWPAVRKRVPGAELRLVGRGGQELGVGGPGVTVTGGVDDVESELGRAHLAVMPIRYGGGTRIKLLEAFAHGLPVVATTVAAEGIEARGDEHLLIADETEALVEGCVTLLSDEGTRQRLSRAAQQLWAGQYQWAPIRARIAEVVAEVAAGH